jgi:hypothetical protein
MTTVCLFAIVKHAGRMPSPHGLFVRADAGTRTPDPFITRVGPPHVNAGKYSVPASSWSPVPAGVPQDERGCQAGASKRSPPAAATCAPGGSSRADGPHGSGYVIAGPGAQLSCARRLAAIYVLSGLGAARHRELPRPRPPLWPVADSERQSGGPLSGQRASLLLGEQSAVLESEAGTPSRRVRRTARDLRVMLGPGLVFSDGCTRHAPSDPYRFGPPGWRGACPGWDWWRSPARSGDAPA